MSSSFQNVVVVGTGGIGTRVAQQISHTQGLNGGHEHPTRLIGLVNSNRVRIEKRSELINLIVSGKMSKDTLREELEKSGAPRDQDQGYTELLKALETQGWDIQDVVFVDTTADKSVAALEFHRKIIREGGQVTTANKNPLSLFPVADFNELTRERNRYKYSASVMAGGPGINLLQDAFDTRNSVTGIEGCFSGTLGYLASGIETRKLSEVLEEAIKKGYTEPNPWDDLNGLDVARKILILARTAGFSLDMKDIKVDPFLPHEFAEYGRDEIVEAVREQLDAEWAKRIDSLLKAGKTLRYVAKLEIDGYGRPLVQVGLQEVDKNSPLGSLSGTKNKISIFTENIGEQTIEQAGAGVNVTAQGVINDLRALLPKTTA